MSNFTINVIPTCKNNGYGFSLPAFDTTGTEPVFNSIRVEKIHLSVQLASDAIVILSNSPDLSSPIIEIWLGADGNTRHRILENGVQNGPDITRTFVLSENVMRTFAIGWEQGFLFVSIIDDDAPLISAMLNNIFDVKYVGVMTRRVNLYFIRSSLMK